MRQVDETLRLKNEAGYLRRELRRLTGLDNIIGHSPKMRAIFDLIQTVAPQSSRVLITGESGTGKELVARAIHENSSRVRSALITINCGAFPETLLESELFGYMKGAFTGANENRQGLFQAAHGGTLFLDEIGNMSLAMQVKLYRVFRRARCGRWEARKKRMWMCASSPPPTAIWRRPSPRESSAKTFSTASV